MQNEDTTGPDLQPGIFFPGRLVPRAAASRIVVAGTGAGGAATVPPTSPRRRGGVPATASWAASFPLGRLGRGPGLAVDSARCRREAPKPVDLGVDSRHCGGGASGAPVVCEVGLRRGPAGAPGFSRGVERSGWGRWPHSVAQAAGWPGGRGGGSRPWGVGASGTRVPGACLRWWYAGALGAPRGLELSG